MDDLIKICDELEKCKNNRICFSNEIVCTKRLLKQYVQDDYNKLLKIKAELKIQKNSDSETLSHLTLLIAAFSFITTLVYNIYIITKEDIIMYVKYVIFLVLILLVVMFIYICFGRKSSARSRWIKYIEVVIHEMEKEY